MGLKNKCMASHSGPSSHHHLNPYTVLPGFNPPGTTNFRNQEGSAFVCGELEAAIVLQGVHNLNNDAAKVLFTEGRLPAATLEMFPAWPIRFQQISSDPRGNNSKSGEESSDSGSALNGVSGKGETQMEQGESPSSCQQRLQEPFFDQKRLQTQVMDTASKTNTGAIVAAGTSQHTNQARPEKTQRRLAQNREAARKSRLRKKAYVQQLESSRMKLARLEEELQRARTQGLFLGVGGVGPNISTGAAIFDVEYARWLDEDIRHMSELRTGLHLPDSDLKLIVDAYITHYDEIFQLKVMAAKSDVLHLITGMWTTPAERCFLWMGGFRPSELIKVLLSHLDPLTEQQIMGIYSLQQSTQQTEDALSQGLERLQQSLLETIAGGCVDGGYEHIMNMALAKLLNLEGFVHQADNLRQQMLHQLCRNLTVRQAAKCFLVIGEYYTRLRALSSLWASRSRESTISDEGNSCQTMTDLQMVRPSQTHFSSF